jgi:deoxyribodipyrimidine photo-lyase
MTNFIEHTEYEFPTDYDEIIKRISKVKPEKYGKTRNFIDGDVSRLSPYISRGVISTKQIFNTILDRGYKLENIEKFIQELAWRDYWQQIWIAKGELINKDLKNIQAPIFNSSIAKVITSATTGIIAIDEAINNLYTTGYMHNHLRMYVASICCNISNSQWKLPAQWMYYHLLDADWASNALSWQWVCGANSNKKYYANQENINKYCYTNDRNTFLDVAYEDFEVLPTPEILKENVSLNLVTPLPKNLKIEVDSSLPTLIYNMYNLDPLWKKELKVNRILLLEPSLFEKYPVGQKTINFILNLSKNIDKIQIYVGEFDEFVKSYKVHNIYFKEHPLSNYELGTEEPRDWMFSVEGYYPSFFSFWKKCKKELYQGIATQNKL